METWYEQARDRHTLAAPLVFINYIIIECEELMVLEQKERKKPRVGKKKIFEQLDIILFFMSPYNFCFLLY